MKSCPERVSDAGYLALIKIFGVEVLWGLDAYKQTIMLPTSVWGEVVFFAQAILCAIFPSRRDDDIPFDILCCADGWTPEKMLRYGVRHAPTETGE